MKRIFTCLLIVINSFILTAQSPASFNYQAIIRDTEGKPLINTNINFQFTIVEETIDGTPVFTETQLVRSNENGVCNIKIGEGSDASASLLDLSWETNRYYLKVGIDKTGNTSFSEIGTMQFVSVPYALHSKSADYATNLGSENIYSPTSDTLFVVKDHDGNIVFAVFPDGAKVYVNNGVKGRVGGFAVTGRNPTKAVLEEDFLFVTPDSTRIYITESDVKARVGGFAVTGRNPTKGDITSDYLNISGNQDLEVVNSEARILWYPKKEAFLSGRVLIENPNNVGTNSMATGFESKAMGDYSQAFGYQSVAEGNYSTAIGNQATANRTGSFALGQWATANNEESYAFGKGAIAEGYRSFAFGSSGVDSSGQVTGVTRAIGDYSFALGQGSISSGFGSFALGLADTASGFYSTAMGYKTKSSGFASTSMGYFTKASRAFATSMGYYSEATGDFSTAIGFESKANQYGTTAIGLGSVASGWYSIAIGTGAKAPGDASVAIGTDVTASGPVALALGNGTISSGNSSATLGVQTNALGDGSFAAGGFTTATGHYSAAMGWFTRASGEYSLAIGDNTVAASYRSLALGSYNDTTIDSTEPLLMCGNGWSEENRFNALTLYTDGNLTIAGTLTQDSDLRLKNVLNDFTGALTELNKITPVYYEFKDQKTHPSGIQIGVIAQEIEEFFPELVAKNGKGYLSVDYSRLSVVAIQAIKEQQQIIETQNEKISKIEQENALLQEKLNEIILLLESR